MAAGLFHGQLIRALDFRPTWVTNKNRPLKLLIQNKCNNCFCRKLIPYYWIDHYLIHIGGFLFDTFIGFLLIHSKTRFLAFILCSAFHLVNSQLFQIGMFPWIMLSLMPIFCSPDWPIMLFKLNGKEKNRIQMMTSNDGKWSRKKAFTFFFIVFYVLIQLALPFAFLILPGYNTWTVGIYGYNWDMMVHNWKHVHTTVKIRAFNGNTNSTIVRYLNSTSWTHNDRWTHNADMVKQFALCVQSRLNKEFKYKKVQVFVDVWTSLNGRFAQQMYDSNIDLVKASWSPFQYTKWIIPIYDDSDYWRQRLQYHFETFDQLVEENQRTGSMALFLANRPGVIFQNYINIYFKHWVNLINFNQMIHIKIINQNGHKRELFLPANGQVQMEPGSLVKIKNVGSKQSYFAFLYPKLFLKNYDTTS